MDLSKIPQNVMFDCGSRDKCLKALERIESEYGLRTGIVQCGEGFTLIKLMIDNRFTNYKKVHASAQGCSIQPVSKLFDILNELKGQFDIGERVVCSDTSDFSVYYEGRFAGYVDERIEVPERFLVNVDGRKSVCTYTYCKKAVAKKEVELSIDGIDVKFTKEEMGVIIGKTHSSICFNFTHSEFKRIIAEYQRFKSL